MAGRFIDKLKIRLPALNPSRKRSCPRQRRRSGDVRDSHSPPPNANAPRKTPSSDDPGAFALQLLIQARPADGNNQPLFTPGDAAILKERSPRLRPSEADAGRAWSG